MTPSLLQDLVSGETVAKDLPLGSKAQPQKNQATWSPGKTCRMGTKRGNIRGCARGLLVSRPLN